MNILYKIFSQSRVLVTLCKLQGKAFPPLAAGGVNGHRLSREQSANSWLNSLKGKPSSVQRAPLLLFIITCWATLPAPTYPDPFPWKQRSSLASCCSGPAVPVSQCLCQEAQDRASRLSSPATYRPQPAEKRQWMRWHQRRPGPKQASCPLRVTRETLSPSCQSKLDACLWPMPVLPAFRKQKQEDQQFKGIRGYTVSSRLTQSTWCPASNETGLGDSLVV